ncbi:MAG: alanine racemase [Gammaproteobacteria bacterium]
MTRPACVIINTQAARANLKTVRKYASHQRVMAIIKADAYGHGLVRMARALSGADAFGVASLEEAQELREHAIEHPVVLLEGPFGAEELVDLARLDIETVIHHDAQLDMLRGLPATKAVRVWLKIDSGMHRLGFPPQRVREVWSRLRECAGVRGTRLMTHLACAQRRRDPSVGEQLQCFAEATSDLEGERCIANSAAIMTCPQALGDWVRPGIMLYGVSPLSEECGQGEELLPVMTLKSALIAVNDVKTGEAVGYGATWRCPQDMRIGIVAMGYGDGYPRHAASGTSILVKGHRAALIGKASMDMLTVDLRGIPDPRVGDPVVLWGEGLPVEEVAQCAETIPYELLCSVRLRARFVEVGDP